MGAATCTAFLIDTESSCAYFVAQISLFGGDPKKVTIWGESAGAGSVFQHVIANGGNTSPPLFRGAITSSTFLPSQYRFNDRIPEVSFRGICATNSGLADPIFFIDFVQRNRFPNQVCFNDSCNRMSIHEKISCSSAADALACLRAVNVNTLQAANSAINLSGFFGTFVFVPVVDGTFITDSPTKILQQGKVNGVCVVFSATISESSDSFS